MFTNVPASVCMSVDELTDFVVRCLPYTDTYKIQNEDVLMHIARYVVERTKPLAEYVIDVRFDEEDNESGYSESVLFIECVDEGEEGIDGSADCESSPEETSNAHQNRAA